MSLISKWNTSLAIDDDLMSWSLGNLVIDLCSRAGLDPDMYDVGSLEGRVRGLLNSNNNSTISVINGLAQNHTFDVSNYDGKVHFIPRGGEVVRVISMDDLIDTGEFDKRTRADSIEVPLTMHLEYFDIDGGLNPDMQTSERSIDSRARGSTKLQTSELLTSDEAARSVAITHKLAIEEQRGTFEFSLTRKHFDLVNGDGIEMDGERLRITKNDIDTNSQKYKASFDRKSAYTSTIKGVPAQSPTPPPDKVIGESIVELIDTHILSDLDDFLGFYIVAERTTPAWEGAAVEISIDGGQSYFDEISIGSEGVIGYLTAPLDTHPHWYQDKLNTLEFRLADTRDELEQFTHRDVLNRRGLIIVGDELMNYEVADDVDGQGNWTVKNLLRGRKGTASTSHAAGERIIFLEAGLVDFIETSLFDVGRTYTLRITSYGTSESTTRTFTYQGKSQIERAPARLSVRRSGSDMIISWIGVGKLGGGGRVSMGAQFDGYRVTIGATVHNTNNMTLTVPYQSGLIRVQQMNKLTATGIAAEITV
ncbi:MAG TPA: phage tail protein [Candidatus Saccharibacteria bacterium]|nr:phage tail protein [Candidatus Saccharibacteria bacterium]